MARAKEFDRDQVLDKAVGLFWCKGYNSASMQEVVDCIGLSRSSIYDTFGDKRGLFMEALKRYRSQMAGSLMQLVISSTDIKQTLTLIFEAAVKESLEDQLHKGCFMVNTTIEMAPHDEEIARLVNKNMQDIEDALYKAIEKGQLLGQVSPDHDPRSLARFIFNNVSGIRVAAKSGADKRVLDDVVKLTLSLL